MSGVELVLAFLAGVVMGGALDRFDPPGRHRPREVMGGDMDTQPGTIWGREPAMVLALVQAVIALVVAFGLNLALDQIGAISPSRRRSLGSSPAAG
jgi:hypothetical protein